ncbi:hypothetical protein ABEV00_26325 [Paenibacillus thiaminolyticus]|uniref:hypothetical protein n=1 Tax=Paenibacillus thiaminolyticus TaxID=49283 RepID=UPI003D282ABA
MKAFSTLLKTELKLSLRGMDMFIFAICLPVAVVIILGAVFGNKPAFDSASYTFLEQSFGAVAAIAICVLYFPMIIFSGATLPYEVMPKALQKAADILPLTQGIKLMKAASLGLPIHSVLLPVLVMILLVIICTSVSIRFFKWE